MTKESKIVLMESKLRVYHSGFLKAKANNDEAAAKKWKAGYRAARERIYELKND